MFYKFLRTIILILQIIIAVAFAGACINGFILTEKTDIQLLESAVRCIALVMFTIFYYSSLKGGFGLETLLIPIYLLFSTLSEIRIAVRFLEISHNMIVPPSTIANIFILCSLMSIISILGYCIYYNSQDATGVLRYMCLGFFGSILMMKLLPSAQSIYDIWNMKALSFLLYAVYVITFLVCVILLITDIPGLSRQRHIIALALVCGNYINLFFSSVVMDTIGTAFLVVAIVFIAILGKRNSIKL